MSEPGVAKVFVHTGASYLLARKRAPGQAKDDRLEHIGGHVGRGETPFDALVREAREQEASGALAAESERQRPTPQRVDVTGGGPPEPHWIYVLHVEDRMARAFRADPKESYGFEFVSVQALDSDEGLHALRDRLTPKTWRIYQALARVGQES